jgi:hypothetical protein
VLSIADTGWPHIRPRLGSMAAVIDNPQTYVIMQFISSSN